MALIFKTVYIIRLETEHCSHLETWARIIKFSNNSSFRNELMAIHHATVIATQWSRLGAKLEI